MCTLPIVFGVPSTLNLQTQYYGSLFTETLQKRPRERDQRMRFETEEMIQCFAFGVSFDLNLQSQSPWVSFQRNVDKET